MILSKENMKVIKLRGSIGEEIAKEDYRNHGYLITPLSNGADFIAIKKTDGKIYQEYVEVKTGKSRLSKTQKKKRIEVRKNGLQYTLYRISQIYLDHHISHQGEEMK